MYLSISDARWGQKKILYLDDSKAMQCGDIPAKILKENIDIYFAELTNIINYFFSECRSSESEVFLGKRCFENMQQIYRRAPIPKCDLEKIALQLHWNCTSAWLFSCKFVAYFQNTFSQKHLWTAASENGCFLLSRGIKYGWSFSNLQKEG